MAKYSNQSLFTTSIGTLGSGVMDGSTYFADAKVEFDCLRDKISILEETVAALPEIFCEALDRAAGEISLQDYTVDAKVTDSVGNVAYSASGELKPNLMLNAQPAITGFYDILRRSVRENFTHTVLARLRGRIAELEADLGYRKEVANKLMEGPVNV